LQLKCTLAYKLAPHQGYNEPRHYGQARDEPFGLGQASLHNSFVSSHNSGVKSLPEVKLWGERAALNTTIIVESQQITQKGKNVAGKILFWGKSLYRLSNNRYNDIYSFYNVEDSK
jgi:hypothetical protein